MYTATYNIYIIYVCIYTFTCVITSLQNVSKFVCFDLIIYTVATYDWLVFDSTVFLYDIVHTYIEALPKHCNCHFLLKRARFADFLFPL